MENKTSFLSFCKEIYHYDGTGQSLAINEITHEICMKKTITYYDLNVFSYLKEHKHQNIPIIYDYYEKEGKLIVAEEFIQGRTLESIIKSTENSESMNDSEKFDLESILLEIMDGIEFLHNAEPKIIHRDIKLSNIMVTNDGVVKIIDYDAAKIYKPSEDRDTILIGTNGCAAPEQYGFGRSDERTDIYAIGILMRKLFPDNSQYKSIEAKATQIDAANRYGSIGEMRNAVLNKKNLPDMTKHRSLWPIPGFRSGKVWKMVVAVLGYIVILDFFFTIKISTAQSVVALWINRICMLAMILSVIDIVCDYSGLFSKFSLLKGRGIVKVVGIILVSFLSFCFWVWIAAIFNVSLF